MNYKNQISDRVKILLIDEDESIFYLIRRVLQRENYRLYTSTSGRSGMEMSTSICPDLILMDTQLSDMDGIGLIQWFREWTDCPILVVSGQTGYMDKVNALYAGADDYIVKPFDAKEVTARIKAVLRRSSAKEEENKGVYDFDNLHLDMNRYELKVKGKVVEAPPKELELLACLAGHPNRVYTRDQLLDEVWGFEYYGDSRTIDVHVKRLREKLEGASEQWSLKTVWGVGYKFEVRE